MINFLHLTESYLKIYQQLLFHFYLSLFGLEVQARNTP